MNNIVFDCERMKYEDSGIFYYCLNLGLHIRDQIDPLTEEILFYVPEKLSSLFGHRHLHQNSLHKICLPLLSKYKVWHSTYQHSDYIPTINRKIKVLLTIHDFNFMYDEYIPEIKKKKYLNNLQKRINRADSLVCISEYVKKDLAAFCYTGTKTITVIHNGTNMLKNPILSANSYKPKRPFLFSIGALRRKKNFHSLLTLIKQNPYLDLVIAGKPEEADYLCDLSSIAIKEGIQDNLHLVGRVTESEKSWYYHNCKAFLMPSIAEGFGLPLAEAMSVGKPIFLSNKTSMPEIGSNAAFYFSDFSKEIMQESFIKGMNQYETQNMMQMIKKRGESFSWEKAAEEYIKVYKSLCNT